MAKTKIEWADESLNCISGCTKVSPGCANCYALTQSHRCAAMGIEKYHGVTEKDGKNIFWTDKIRWYPEILDEPGKRKKPTRFFINSMSDTFHIKVPFTFIDMIIQMCLNNPCHEFMILTKRPENIILYLTSKDSRAAMLSSTNNLILMTSMENQETAISRMKSFIWIRTYIPGFPVGLSLEPLLGPIDFDKIECHNSTIQTMNWIIVGGESGPRARPMHPQWVRSIRTHCMERDIPFFFKQWGEWLPSFQKSMFTPAEMKLRPKWIRLNSLGNTSNSMEDPMNSSTDELFFYRVGKKKAGRLLDGRTWDELPNLYGRPRS